MPEINYQNPRPKDKRILKAHRKRFVEDKDLHTVADELGISYSTVKKYFTEDSQQRIKQLYDEEETEFLRLQLFNKGKEASDRAENYVGRAVSDERIRPNELLRAAKEEQEIPLRYAEMLQELGILDKPKERKEVEEKSGESVEFEMRYTSSDEEDEQSVEA